MQAPQASRKRGGWQTAATVSLTPGLRKHPSLLVCLPNPLPRPLCHPSDLPAGECVGGNKVGGVEHPDMDLDHHDGKILVSFVSPSPSGQHHRGPQLPVAMCGRRALCGHFAFIRDMRAGPTRALTSQ